MHRVEKLTITAFNALPADRAHGALLACCAAARFAGPVADGRPYPDRAALFAAADAALRALDWSDVAQALAAHPRIGERATGAGPEAAWSRREQAGVAADEQTRQALAQANRDYEQRFGHLFLIFANGRGETELLAAARARLANDEPTERRIVAEELRRIALLRLERLCDDG